jgi:hypothetical protein
VSMNEHDRSTARKSVTPISISEAAGLTGRTAWSASKLTERGQLPFAMLHGVRWVAREDVPPLPRRRFAK